MALEMNDIMALKSMGGHDGSMTPYEQVKIGMMQSRRPSGAAIGGLATGIAAAVAAVGVGFSANAKASAAREAARGAQETAKAQYDGLAALLANMNANTSANIDRQPASCGGLLQVLLLLDSAGVLPAHQQPCYPLRRGVLLGSPRGRMA